MCNQGHKVHEDQSSQVFPQGDVCRVQWRRGGGEVFHGSISSSCFIVLEQKERMKL